MRPAAIFLVARRFVRGRSRDGMTRKYVRGAILAVAIALVPLVLVLHVADGMIDGITARYVALETAHLRSSARDPGDAMDLAERIAAVPGVVSALPEIRTVGMGFTSGAERSVALRGLPDGFWSKDPGFAEYLRVDLGELGFPAPNSAIVSSGIAKRLGLEPGAVFAVVTVRRDPIDGGFLPKTSILRVSAVVSSGYLELDETWVFVPLGLAADLGDRYNSVAFANVKVEGGPSISRSLYDEIARAAGPSHPLRTWSDLERNLFKSLNSTRMVLLLVMAMIVAVASVNVSSAVLMIVLEKRAEIAIMRGTGASPGGIAALFVACGTFVGAIGGATGTLAGAFASLFVNEILHAIESVSNWFIRLWAGPNAVGLTLLNPEYYLDRIPISPDPGALLLVFFGVVSLSAIASLLPARRAAGLPPNELMRRR